MLTYWKTILSKLGIEHDTEAAQSTASIWNPFFWHPSWYHPTIQVGLQCGRLRKRFLTDTYSKFLVLQHLFR